MKRLFLITAKLQIMGGRGWWLESAVDGRWNLNIQHPPEPHKITEFSTHRGQITDFWMCCLTRSPNFLPIVEKCQIFGCVASPDHRILFSVSIQQHSALTGAPRDHRIFFSSWRNDRPVDVLPHQITELSSQFVEWAQNEIAVVPDFHKRILFSDEAHFWLNGYVNKRNCRIWSEANPQVYVETPLHPEKLTVWCALWAGGILLQKR
ncbi:hypothetical protein TNCV_5061411 [Trichonephila clavipes]|nr:hypothetical protein TNCV_5061411 [Trichonephila clavipes]